MYHCIKDIAALSSLTMVLFGGVHVCGVFNTKVIERDQTVLTCIGDTVAFICQATNTSSNILRLRSNDFGGVTVIFFTNDSLPIRNPGYYYTVTLVSSSPLLTARAEVTATLALNGSKVTCEEYNGMTFTLIGNGYIYVQVPPGPPNIATISMGEDWMTVALTKSINGGVPFLFIITINNSTTSINGNTINGTAMVNLTGLSDCKTPYEISVTALNCAGNASSTTWSQLLCQTLHVTSEGIPSTLIPTPTSYTSEHDILSPALITIASATTAVAILFFVILIIALIAVHLLHRSRVTRVHQITITSVYEEVTSQQNKKEERITVQSNEAYQKPSTTAMKVNVAYAQVQC